jgi:hypothetical protein
MKMLPLDSVLSLKPNSVILDNTTLFTCYPLRTKFLNGLSLGHWYGKWWGKHLIEWGMSNLVESLILYECIYVDGHSKYQAPIVEEIAEQFDGLVRGIDAGEFREEVFTDLESISKHNDDFVTTLYLVGSGYRQEGLNEALHLSYIHEFLYEEIQARDISGYLPQGHTIEPIVFRTYYYMILSSLANRPYVPYPIRNPILFALSDHISLSSMIDREKPYYNYANYYHEIAQNILDTFDAYVREALSEKLKTGPLRLPSLPMPTFWEIIKERSRGQREEIVKQVIRLRQKAEPYRDYVSELASAYNSGDLEFLQKESAKLKYLQERWEKNLELPRLVWKKLVIPLSIKPPFVDSSELKLTLRYPTLNPYRKHHFVFLHDWIERRF